MNNLENQFKRLSFEFFEIFSRLEFALKATSYNQGNGPAKVDWSAFAEDARVLLEDSNDQNLNEAIQYILSSPPKKQVIENDQIAWHEIEPNHKNGSELILLYVRRIRNNLFHGGKFYGYWVEPDRDIMLLKCSILILSECTKLSREVCEAYHSD